MTAFRNQVRYYHTGQSFTNTSAARRVASKWRLRGAHAAGPGAPGAGVVIFFGASGTIRENIVEGSVAGHGPLSSEPTAYLSAGIMVEPDHVALESLAALVDEGRLSVHVARSFAFDEIAAAHRFVEDGHMTGKVVLLP